MIRFKSPLPKLLISLVIIAAPGCGDTGSQRRAISGSVTLDGQPVNNATLILTPQGPGLSAAAQIVDGQFALSADVGPTQGDFSVRINPAEVEFHPTTSARKTDGKSRQQIPQRYQRPGELSVKITDDPAQTLELKLSSKAQ